MREFGECDPDVSRMLQVRGPNEILTFLEWPAAGLPVWTCGMIASALAFGERRAMSLSPVQVCPFLDRRSSDQGFLREYSP
jgi:hypothetical protein